MNSKLILGTVQFGMNYGINNHEGKPSFEKMKNILDLAKLKGINLLDTAEAYGDSQNRIGEYHNTCSDKFNIITKFSPNRLDLSKNIKKRINQNLVNLNVKYLYSYMFHSFEDYKKYFSLFKKDLIWLKKNKKIKKIGVSLHSNAEITEVLLNDHIDLIQLPFNLFDNSNHRQDILLKAKSNGVEIHTRSVFLQGLFFKDPNKISGNLIDFKRHLTKLYKLVNLEKMNDLALNYVCSKDYVDGVLFGVDSVEQLKSNIDSYEANTTLSMINEVDKIHIKNKSLLNPANWNK